MRGFFQVHIDDICIREILAGQRKDGVIGYQEMRPYEVIEIIRKGIHPFSWLISL